MKNRQRGGGVNSLPGIQRDAPHRRVKSVMGTEPLVCGGFSRQGWRTGCYIFSRFTSVRSCFIYSAIISQCPKPNFFSVAAYFLKSTRRVARSARASIVCHTHFCLSLGRASYVFWCYLSFQFDFNNNKDLFSIYSFACPINHNQLQRN